jgi:hypothetical protein
MRYTEWQSMPHREKSLYNEFNFISTVANSGIPKIFYRRCDEVPQGNLVAENVQGLNRDGIKPHPSTFPAASTRILARHRKSQIYFIWTNQCLQRMLDGSEFAPQCEAYSVKRQRVQEPDGSSAQRSPLPRAGKKVSRNTGVKHVSAFKQA